MAVRTAERETFLADIIITAIEGGTGYWAEVHSYKHADLPPSEVHAIIMEQDDDHESRLRYVSRSFQNVNHRLPKASELLDIKFEIDGDAPLLYKIDIETIAKGISKIKELGFSLNKATLTSILLADRELDAGDIDAHGADAIVQAALFGELVYG